MCSSILVLAFVAWVHTAASLGPEVLVWSWDRMDDVEGYVAPRRRKDAFKMSLPVLLFTSESNDEEGEGGEMPSLS